MASILLQNITKVFDNKVVAVKDLTLEIPDKGLVSLLGPSGCGKTTTMRIISGLEEPTAGKVFFDGRDVTQVSPEERNVAMVFQFPVVYPGMTVYENIAFPLVAHKVPKKEIKRRVEEVAEVFEISHLLKQDTYNLDAGIKQKIVLARAFVRKPNVYLLDEPLTNVDPATRLELRTILKRLQSNLGQTMVYVTHDQGEALTLADRIAVMNEGKVLQYDSPEEVYSNPSNTFVGYFIGNPGMNFLNCSLQAGESVCIMQARSFSYVLKNLSRDFLGDSEKRELIIGIRPENLEILFEPREGYVPFEVVLSEPIGNRLVLHLRSGEDTLKAKIPRTSVEIGQKVWVGFPLEFLKFFDAQTLEAVEV